MNKQIFSILLLTTALTLCGCGRTSNEITIDSSSIALDESVTNLTDTVMEKKPSIDIGEYVRKDEVQDMIDEAVNRAVAEATANFKSGLDGRDGKDGRDGVGISAAAIDASGNLVLAYTDGSIVSVGSVKGDTGANGSKGIDGTDGITPHIGENGNWFIGDEDTNISAGCDNSSSDFLFNDGGKGTELIAYLGSDYNVTIPDKCTKICHNAFQDTLSHVKSITMSNNVKEIEYDAFHGMTELENIRLSNSIEKIGENSFYNCKKLQNIVIPGSVKTIGRAAFYGCSSLTSLVLNSGLKEIGTVAFTSCGLTEIIIPSTVEIIGTSAFSGCRNLASVTISEGVKTIGSAAFFSTKLTSIIIPSTVTQVGSWFVSNSCIETLIIKADVPPEILPMETGTGEVYEIFEYSSLPTSIKVPLECIDTYRYGQYWGDFSYLYESI